MKKLISIAAALTTAVSSSALSAGAMFENIPSTRIWEEEFEMFDAMDSGALITDINGDGSFTIADCYALYCYTEGCETDEAATSDADKIADYDGSKSVDYYDTVHLIRYFILKNGLTREVTKPSYYSNSTKQSSAKADNGGLVSAYSYDLNPGKGFVSLVLGECGHLQAGYPVFCEMLESKEIDYDINGDGKLFFDDINYLWVYCINNTNCAYMDFTMAEAAQISGEMYYPCQKLENGLRRDMGCCWVYEYALMYCFEKYELKQEYLTNDYYEDIFAGSGKYDFGKYAKQCYEERLPKNEYLTFNGALFNREYIRFINEKADDPMYIPDTNGDGILNIYDTFNTYIYMDDLYSEADAGSTILPDDVWKYFTERCDLNGNGLCGDLHDLSMLNLFILDKLEDEDCIEMYDNYSDKLKAYIGRLSNNSGRPAVKYSPEKYSSPVALSDDLERTGDSNADGKKDMADVVFIMQSLANPDKYKLSAIGRFNADINNTGDGITLMDAQAMQERLLGLA